ncbi:MAG: nitroreductase family deazaflavin-dependent oxidoreductase [Chloroflexota bacterium]
MGIAQFDWRRIRNVQKMHRLLYALGFGPLIGRIVLLLTTTGRKSGQPRVTPLQYEEIGGVYYVGAARGLKADWVRNIQAAPQVSVRVKSLRFDGRAEIITEPAAIADYLETRLLRHPRMMGLMMQRAHGLPARPARSQLETLAQNLVVVAIYPSL